MHTGNAHSPNPPRVLRCDFGTPEPLRENISDPQTLLRPPPPQTLVTLRYGRIINTLWRWRGEIGLFPPPPLLIILFFRLRKRHEQIRMPRSLEIKLQKNRYRYIFSYLKTQREETGRGGRGERGEGRGDPGESWEGAVWFATLPSTHPPPTHTQHTTTPSPFPSPLRSTL